MLRKMWEGIVTGIGILFIACIVIVVLIVIGGFGRDY